MSGLACLLRDLTDELGDLLFQVVFHARMAEEARHFAFADVAAAISDKMERRHPHVFGAVEIREGLTPESVVITGGVQKIRDGIPVRPAGS